MIRYAVLDGSKIVNIIDADNNNKNLEIINTFYKNKFKVIKLSGKEKIFYGSEFINNSFTDPRPYESWQFIDNQWIAPVPYPKDGATYIWDENSLNWFDSKNLPIIKCEV